MVKITSYRAEKAIGNFQDKVCAYILAGMTAKGYTRTDLAIIMDTDPIYVDKVLAGNCTMVEFAQVCHYLDLYPAFA